MEGGCNIALALIRFILQNSFVDSQYSEKSHSKIGFLKLGNLIIGCKESLAGFEPFT